MFLSPECLFPVLETLFSTLLVPIHFPQTKQFYWKTVYPNLFVFEKEIYILTKTVSPLRGLVILVLIPGVNLTTFGLSALNHYLKQLLNSEKGGG